MDSTSNSPKWKYDVFLSAFSDQILRSFITDHVCRYLEEDGINVYRDDISRDVSDQKDKVSFQKGSDFSTESLPTRGLMKVIEESRISVIIFNKDYANSQWCLRILAKIMDSMKTTGQVVIPAFLTGVSPSDLRVLAKSIAKLPGIGKEKRVLSNINNFMKIRGQVVIPAFLTMSTSTHQWDAAVAELASLPGIEEVNGHSADFIKKLIQMVVDKHVSLSGKKILPAAEQHVGLNSQIEHVCSLLKKGSKDVHIIGILGRNGLENNALAKAVFDLSFHEYTSFCFLKGDRHSAREKDPNLQETHVSSLLTRRQMLNSQDGSTGENERAMLLLVDDIDKLSHLEILESVKSYIGPGSRIIVTTREERFLDRLKVDDRHEIKLNLEGTHFAKWKYDVFVSSPRIHLTQGCITDNICNGLVGVGLRVFRDDVPMVDADEKEIYARMEGSAVTGESFPTEVQMKAIEESRISVIIFSRFQAASRRSLMVIAKIIECMKTRGQVVIPAIYTASKDSLTAEGGSFATEVARYFPNEAEAHQWRAAVVEAANLPGIEYVGGRTRGDFIRQVIQKVVDEHVYLGGKEPLVPAQHSFELKSQVEDVCSLLNRGSKDVRVIGILGRNGSRKTILAKAAFAQTRDKFELFCFLGDGESPAQKDLNSQALLVSCLLEIRGRFMSENAAEGNSEYEMLIVVDNIDKGLQFRRLEQLRPYIGPGSRIVVTTSDQHFLDNLKVDEKYKMKLNVDDSKYSEWQYDVFVSAIRWNITQACCTDNICNGLEELGLRIFRDDVPMVGADETEIFDRVRGREITSESLPSEIHMKAIEESRISVIIFMATHAASRRCLMVTEKIIECMKTRGQMVIPVFYSASRSFLENESGEFAQDIAKYYPNEVEAHRWCAAVAEAAKLPGINYDGRNMAGFIKEVIQTVVDEHVDFGGKEPLAVAQHNDQLTSKVEQVRSLIQKGSKDVRIIGILGRNGIDETVLAKAILDQTCQEFNRYCFLKGGGHSSVKKDNNLRDKLVSNLLATRDQFNSNATDQGKDGVDMLIVVDDIDKVSQLERLENIRHDIGPGSRIIVTTRDRRFLDKVKVDEKCKIKWNVEETDPVEWKYDVFVSSIRRNTIKNCITDHICSGLEEAGLRIFRDDVPMDDADERAIDNRVAGITTATDESSPTEEHMKAIEESRISVILFTNRHSESRRCLMVGAKMMECMKTKGQVIIPAFYTTNRSKQLSEAEDEVIKRYYPNEAEIHEWRVATTEVANFPGLEYDDCSSRADFIKLLIQMVVDEHVDLGGQKQLPVFQEYVGLNSHVESICSLLNKGSKDVRIIGIYGMKGCGKTVLAKTLFNHFFHEFKLFCLLRSDEHSSTEQDPNLQETIVSNLLSTRDRFRSGNATGESTQFEMLIVVDDIERLSQLKALDRERKNIGPGSRIIVTTRDLYFLDKLKVDERYKIKWNVEESDPVQWKYDVFVSSIRWNKIKHCVTDHICSGLEEAGLRVFRDDVPMDDADESAIDDRVAGTTAASDESLPTEEHMKAIEESRISVILFTSKHSASRRCLMAGAKMMECMKTKGQVIIPAFYTTNRSKQLSKIEDEAIKRYYPNEEEAHEWRTAAAEAATFPGLERGDCSSAADFIKQLIQIVVDEHVDLGGQKQLPVAQEYVGLNSHVENVCSLLNEGSNDVRIIGILGLKGCGKTVLAKTLFNHIFHKFEFFCHLRGEERSSTEKDRNLQETVVSNLLSTRDRFKSENSTRESGKFKMLIVVDDIEKLSLLKALETELKDIGPGSRIIVTTRDRRFLDKLKVDEKYKIKWNVEESDPVQWKYDVFVSAIRSYTIKDCITDHICSGLEEAGLRVFRDDVPMDDADRRAIDDRVAGTSMTSHESLPTEEHVKAIEESRISVILFTSKHSASRRCLMVGAKMMECMKTKGQVIIPAFYTTDQSTQSSEEEGEVIKRYYPNEAEVHEWRVSAAEAANFPGLEYDHCSSRADFIKQLIQMVVDEHVDLGGQKQIPVAQEYVGLNSHVESICSLLNKGSKDVRIIGIYGMKGCGKTVLAKTLFNHFFHEFKLFCFLRSDERDEHSSTEQDPNLQETIVSNLLSTRDRFKSGNATGESSFEMLIVVDDIENLSQLKALEREWTNIGPGSRIIVTTTDWRFLDKLKVDEKYKIKGNVVESDPIQWKYDVFVSAIRWQTIKNCITDHICNGLEEAGLRIFRDDVPMDDADERAIGDRVAGITTTTDESLPTEEHMKAIEESRISVILFTSRHSASRRCLMVGAKIMECMKTKGQVIIPAFNTTNRSTQSSEEEGEAIKRYYPNEAEAHEWRIAAAEAATFPGLEQSDCSSAADFIKQLIQIVVDEHVDLGGQKHLPVAQEYVGVNSHVENLCSLLNEGLNDVRIIGIFGLKGWGKTVLAKALFNHIFHKFPRFCFLRGDERSSTERDRNLEETIVSNLLSTRDRFKSEKATRESGKFKMLIVVDDIEKLSRLKALEKELNGIGPGSRIIITTRDRRFLDKLKVDEKYKIKWNVEESDPVQWKYDVFVSAIRSYTIKDCITDHICSGLEEAGLRVFRDDVPMDDADERTIKNRVAGSTTACDESLPTEEDMKAIEESRISVILFTKNYSASQRCLMVGAKMMECMKTKGQVIIPAFYTTTHSSEGEGEAGKRYYPNEAEAHEWRIAVAEAATFAGLEFDDCSSIADFIKQLIQMVIDEHVELGGQKHLPVAQEYVGLNYHVEHICSLLNKGSKDVRIIGIFGMKGWGKTVLAKALFNHIFHEFELFCCLRGHEHSSTEQDPNLHETLVSNVLSTRDRFKSENATGKSGEFKMLIVVDDIEKLSQLKALERERSYIGPGSRIIVTTTDEHFLDELKVDEKYKMKLGVVESFEVFNRHAFVNAEQTEGFGDLTYHLVRHANGHLPAIKGLSSYLLGRPIEEWKLALQKIDQIPKHQIRDKLSMFNLLQEDDADLPRKDKFMEGTSSKMSLDSKSGSCSDSCQDQSAAVSRVLAESFGGSSNTVVEDVEVFLMKAPSHQRTPVMPNQQRRQLTRVRTIECPICCKHIHDIVSTACGHVTCGSCLLKSIALSVHKFDCKVCWDIFVKAFDANFDPVFCESCVIKSTAGGMKCPICRTSISVKGNKLDLIFTKARATQKSWSRQ